MWNPISAVTDLVKDLAPVALAVAFPQAALASSLTDMLTKEVVGAVFGAGKELINQGIAPKFLGKELAQVLEKFLGEMKPSDRACDQEVNDRCGGGVRDFGRDLMRDIVNNGLELDRCGNGGGKKPKSFFDLLVQALKKSIDQATDKVEKLAGQITDENAKDKPSTMTELQGATQQLSFKMSACDNVIKTVGEVSNKGASK